MADGFLDPIAYLRRAQPIRTNVACLALNLLFDARDANLEELIQIRTDDGKKLDPLNERLPLILRFFQDAAVELEPAQLAVDEIFWLAKTLMRGLLRRLNSDRADFLFGSSSGLGFGHLSTSPIKCAYATRAVSDRSRGSLMPDVFSSGSVNGVLGNVGSMIAHALEMSADKH